jgi:hypothetical protein
VRGQVYREEPVKNHPWSDFADALCYLIACVAPVRAASLMRGKMKPSNIGAFSPFASRLMGRS